MGKTKRYSFVVQESCSGPCIAGCNGYVTTTKVDSITDAERQVIKRMIKKGYNKKYPNFIVTLYRTRGGV
jgi:hypothetical protein